MVFRGVGRKRQHPRLCRDTIHIFRRVVKRVLRIMFKNYNYLSDAISHSSFCNASYISIEWRGFLECLNGSRMASYSFSTLHLFWVWCCRCRVLVLKCQSSFDKSEAIVCSSSLHDYDDVLKQAHYSSKCPTMSFIISTSSAIQAMRQSCTFILCNTFRSI